MPRTKKQEEVKVPKKRGAKKGRPNNKKGKGFDWIMAKKLFLNSHYNEVKPFFREEFGWDDKKMESGYFKDNVVGWKDEKVAYKGKVESNQLVRALFEQGIVLSEINKTRIATMTNAFYVTSDILAKMSDKHIKGEIGIPFWMQNYKGYVALLEANVKLGKELATSFEQEEGRANPFKPSERKINVNPTFIKAVDPEGTIDTTDVAINE